ncbi:MAG: hypothetical protein OXT07_04530 [bacterium]|nr:hypothetical protein [bacterium]
MADQDGFTALEIENLQHYVYFFQDPRDGTIFYVGKGKGNRFLSRLHTPMKMNGTTSGLT